MDWYTHLLGLDGDSKPQVMEDGEARGGRGANHIGDGLRDKWLVALEALRFQLIRARTNHQDMNVQGRCSSFQELRAMEKVVD